MHSWKKAVFAAGIVLAVTYAPAARAQTMTFVMQPFPPFAIDDRGVARGVFPEFLKRVCDALGTTCRIEIYPWRRALRLAEEGRVDGILVVQRLPERADAFYLTEPLVQSAYGVFMADDVHGDPATPAGLAGYAIGAYGPSATSQAAQHFMQPIAGATLMLEVDNLTVLRKLSARRYGERGAGFLNIDVAQALMRQYRIEGVRFAGEVRRIEYSIGLSKKRCGKVCAGRFNNVVHELMRDGTLYEIASRAGVRQAAIATAQAEH